MRVVLRLLVGLMLLSCSDSASAVTAEPIDPDARQVLFIGNSLTYFGDLPVRIAEVVTAAGGQRLQYTVIAKPDYGLADHWREGKAQQLLQQRRWDYVVMQQGPSTLPESRADLREWVGRFAPLIRAAGATPALYGVWPDASRQAFLGAADESYRLAAEDVGGLYVPAARAWGLAWTVDPTLGFYADGLHPSALGVHLVALTFAAALDQRRPSVAPPAGVSSELEAVLEEAAAAAVGVTP